MDTDDQSSYTTAFKSFQKLLKTNFHIFEKNGLHWGRKKSEGCDSGVLWLSPNLLRLWTHIQTHVSHLLSIKNKHWEYQESSRLAVILREHLEMCGVEGDAGAAAATQSEEPQWFASSLERRSHETTWEAKYTEHVYRLLRSAYGDINHATWCNQRRQNVGLWYANYK